MPKEDLYTICSNANFTEEVIRSSVRHVSGKYEYKCIGRLSILARALRCYISESKLCYIDEDERYIKIREKEVDFLVKEILYAQKEGKKKRSILEKRAPNIDWKRFDKDPCETCETCDQCHLIYPISALYPKGDALVCFSCCKSKKKNTVPVKEEENLCAICMDNSRNAVFSACGHANTCLDCAEHVDKCPICRTPKDKIIRVYL